MQQCEWRQKRINESPGKTDKERAGCGLQLGLVAACQRRSVATFPFEWPRNGVMIIPSVFYGIYWLTCYWPVPNF